MKSKKKKKRNIERELDFLRDWLDLVASFAQGLASAASSYTGWYWAEPFKQDLLNLKKKYPEDVKWKVK